MIAWKGGVDFFPFFVVPAPLSLTVFDLPCSIETYHFKELQECAKQNVSINKLQNVSKYLGKPFSMQNNYKNFLPI